MAVRDWGRSSREVCVVQGGRIATGLLRRAFDQMASEDEAVVRTRVSYFHQVGYYAIAFREPRPSRLHYLPIYDDVLTGRPSAELERVDHLGTAQRLHLLEARPNLVCRRPCPAGSWRLDDPASGDEPAWPSSSSTRRHRGNSARDLVLPSAVARHGCFWPADRRTAAGRDCWMDWSLRRAAARFHGSVLGLLADAGGGNVSAQIARAQEACAEHYRLLDRHLADRPFLAGDAFGLADISSGTTLHRYFGLGLAVPSVPHVEAWHRRLAERPAYRDHVAMPFDDMYGRTTAGRPFRSMAFPNGVSSAGSHDRSRCPGWTQPGSTRVPVEAPAVIALTRNIPRSTTNDLRTLACRGSGSRPVNSRTAPGDFISRSGPG